MLKTTTLCAMLFLCLFITYTHAQGPAVTSWVINNSTPILTGYNCSGCSPAVAGNIPANVQSVYYDATYAYISTTGIPSYNIGPWTNNPNTPSNQNKIYRIKRNPTNNATHTATPFGNIGVWSNGIGIFNAKDGMSYNNAGVWNQNALYYEGISFDACLGHPAPGGNYHNHVNPSCLYNHNNSSVHSPILGYAFDGYPIYGAYGYASPMVAGALKRMVSSYVLSSNSTRANGPAVSATYPNGCFCEDYIYSAGSGDLDQYNGRTCVTPEYPGGTYAYFVTINSSGVPQYPFVIGPTYYGTYSMANTVTSIPGGATLYSPPLPIKLSNFWGKHTDAGNLIQWNTASERNMAGFELEYSTDGEQFEFLVHIPSKSVSGNSSVQLGYEFTDKNPAAAIVYYRLKQTDLDGTFQFSHIVSINRGSRFQNVRIYPNPVLDNLIHLSVEDNSKDMQLILWNAQGRVLVEQTYIGNEYNREITLHAPYLSGGLYWLTIESEGNKMVKTVVFEEE